LDLKEFGNKEKQSALRSLLIQCCDVFSSTRSTVPGYEFGLDLKEGADLSILNRPSFAKSRVEKEMEAERIRELVERGILVPSTSAFATNSILVGKKTNADGSAGVMRATSDFRAVNSLTENIAYPTEDVKAIIRWLATKKIFSVADLRDGYYNVRLRNKDSHLTAVRTVWVCSNMRSWHRD
jgi:hypothetical protein